MYNELAIEFKIEGLKGCIEAFSQTEAISKPKRDQLIIHFLKELVKCYQKKCLLNDKKE